MSDTAVGTEDISEKNQMRVLIGLILPIPSLCENRTEAPVFFLVKDTHNVHTQIVPTVVKG